MGEKEELKTGNHHKNKNDHKSLEEKNKAIGDSDILDNDIQIKFDEFDSQKGGLSPRKLFKKRRNEDTTIFFKKNKNGDDILGPTNKKEKRIKNAFEALLDYVREVYFTNNYPENEANNSINSEKDNDFKFTTLDLLIKPLRKNFTWETWSPYEIALFNCCICKFGTNFKLYLKIIKTKTIEEIIDFYYTWKSSKYYKIWKNQKRKLNT